MRKKIWQILSWGFLFLLGGIAFLGFYCVRSFKDLEKLMTQTPESHPAIIYSDTFEIKKDQNYLNLFLIERLQQLKKPFVKSIDGVQWEQAGRTVSIKIQDSLVDTILDGTEEKDSIILDPTPIFQLTGTQRETRDYIPLPEIPTKLLKAIIAIEDQRFLEHIGFDLKSLARALWINLRSRALAQGGSTITQQLVKNLLGQREKTLLRKLRELVLAVLLEVRYSKEQILEKYLNEVYFGQVGAVEVHGVSEAAKYFYNKSLSRLNLAEMAFLAGIIRGPAVYSPYKNLKQALERKDIVLKKMESLRLITPQESKSALAQKLTFAPILLGLNQAHYFVDYVIAQILDQLHSKITHEDLTSQGLQIYTTLDIILQKKAESVVKQIVQEMEARYKIQPPQRLEGVLVIADHEKGLVRALVGGRSFAETTFNRVLNMKRQVGSTFKPVVYLAAFLKGKDSQGNPYNADYLIEDEPWTYEWENQKWSPKNYEKAYRGQIYLRDAFANSINIPVAKIGMDVGLDFIVDVAHKLGVSTALPKVPSLTLGAVDLSPMELLQIYSTFANLGKRVELTTIHKIENTEGGLVAQFIPREEQVYDLEVMKQIKDLLEAVVTEGTAKSMRQLGYSKNAYGKTGTTSYSRDSWFAGYSEGLAAVSWIGYDELKMDKLDRNVPAVQSTLSRGHQAIPPAPASLTGAGTALPLWTRFFISSKP